MITIVPKKAPVYVKKGGHLKFILCHLQNDTMNITFFIIITVMWTAWSRLWTNTEKNQSLQFILRAIIALYQL